MSIEERVNLKLMEFKKLSDSNYANYQRTGNYHFHQIGCIYDCLCQLLREVKGEPSNFVPAWLDQELVKK